MDSFVERASPLAQTMGSDELVGRKVFAKSGVIVGTVKSVRMGRGTYDFEGIVVGNLWNARMYVCKSYIGNITAEAVFLSIEPATLFLGKPVVSSDGKRIGAVKMVNRVKDTNRIESFLVKWGLYRKVTVMASEVAQFGDSIILSKTYERFKNGNK